jgi:hypothetical protein
MTIYKILHYIKPLFALSLHSSSHPSSTLLLKNFTYSTVMNEIVWAREGFRKLQKRLGGTVVASSLQADVDNSAQIIKLSIADKDIKDIRDLVKTLPESRCVRNFTWPIVGNIAIFVSKRDTHADFTPIYDYTAVEKWLTTPLWRQRTSR